MSHNQEPDGRTEAFERLSAYLKRPGDTNSRFNPRWLAQHLGVEMRALLSALAVAVRDGDALGTLLSRLQPSGRRV